MALRLIEMVLQEKDGADVRELLNEHKVLEHRQIRLPDGEVMVRILLDATERGRGSDGICWRKRYTGEEGNRVVILPVEAKLPRAEPELDLSRITSDQAICASHSHPNRNLFPGGNDYPAKEAGALSIQVRDPNESKRVIEAIIACLDGAQATKPLKQTHP